VAGARVFSQQRVMSELVADSGAKEPEVVEKISSRARMHVQRSSCEPSDSGDGVEELQQIRDLLYCMGYEGMRLQLQMATRRKKLLMQEMKQKDGEMMKEKKLNGLDRAALGHTKRRHVKTLMQPHLIEPTSCISTIISRQPSTLR
jgi:hypothetical protein